MSSKLFYCSRAGLECCKIVWDIPSDYRMEKRCKHSPLYLSVRNMFCSCQFFRGKNDVSMTIFWKLFLSSIFIAFQRGNIVQKITFSLKIWHFIFVLLLVLIVKKGIENIFIKGINRLYFTRMRIYMNNGN